MAPLGAVISVYEFPPRSRYLGAVVILLARYHTARRIYCSWTGSLRSVTLS